VENLHPADRPSPRGFVTFNLRKHQHVMMEQGRTMMEFSKQVLQKVSFDPRLFKKELIKARKWVGSSDQIVLKAWCLATFGHMYKDVIMEVFQTTMRT
jgi:hypothetical protein